MPSMISRRSAPRGWQGCQEPRISLVPEYVSTAGQEAVELAAVAGLHLDPWQQLVLCDALGERRDGRWAAFEVGLVVARQNGKDSILEAREIAGLFLFGERLIVHSAHKFDTAMEHLERLCNLIEAAELSKRIRKVNRSHGSEGITLKDGRRVRFRARTTSGGGRGYTGDCVIFNEAMDLPDSVVGAMMPMMAARSGLVPGPQIWYAGSAVDQETMANGLVLARVREAGIAGENDRMAYFEWSAEDDADPEDWDARAAANPGGGYRITPEYIETEFNSPGMSLHQFGVERLGKGNWPATGEDASRVIARELWGAAAEHDPSNRITSRETFAIDASPDHTWAAIGVAGLRDDELHQFAVVDHERGMGWVVLRVADLQRDHPGSEFVVDTRGPAAFLIPELERAGVRIRRANTEDYGNACGQFVDEVVNGGAKYPAPQPELDDAIGSARAATLGDRWKWARRSPTGSDISPLVAVTLALWGAQSQRIPEVWNLADFVKEPAPATDEGSGQRFVSEMPAFPRTVFSRSPSSGSWGG